jgi:DNA-binding transcriptional LysR family regulator
LETAPYPEVTVLAETGVGKLTAAIVFEGNPIAITDVVSTKEAASVVAAGLGLALVPESVVSDERHDLATATLRGERFVREIGVAVAPHAPRPLVEPFVERLLENGS